MAEGGMFCTWQGDVQTKTYVVTADCGHGQDWLFESRRSDSTPSRWKHLDCQGALGLSESYVYRVFVDDTIKPSIYKVGIGRSASCHDIDKPFAVGIRLLVSQENRVLYSEDGYDYLWFDDVSTSIPSKCAKTINYHKALQSQGTDTRNHQFSLAVFDEGPHRGRTIIQAEIQIPDGQKSSTKTFPELVLKSLALNFDQPNCADVEFIFKGGEEIKKLYGISNILEMRSSYFRRMFNARFAEKNAQTVNMTKLGLADIKATLRTPRRHVTIKERFDLFKIVLFYLYTDSVCFTTLHDIRNSDGDIPTTDDPEGIYAIARRLMLDDLCSKAAQFLKDTCTIHNITARAFGKFAATYEAVGKIYDQYLLECWHGIVGAAEFEEFFQDAEEDREEFIRIHTKLRNLIRRQSEYERPMLNTDR